MGRCPSCGASSFIGVHTKQCANCGKIICNKCVPQWQGTLTFKQTSEGPPTTPAYYETVGFCSTDCFSQFWQRVFDYPVDYEVGTDVDNFYKNLILLWNQAITSSTEKCNPAVGRYLVPKVNFAQRIHSSRFPAFPWLDKSGKAVWMFEKFRGNSRTALAQNLEKCGRTQDSAKIFEDLRMYDKARELRERDRHIVVKKTDVSINLNSLLQQVKEGGVVAIFRCPHCGGKLKISDKTTLNSLRKCEHCGSEIESMDLADFFKTVLS
jgi:transcription elongation factor Elf1